VNITDFFAQLQITPAASLPQFLTGDSIQGTGPYRFSKWTPGVGFRVEPNPNWHASDTEGGPYLDAIDMKYFADNDAMSLAYDAGDLDMVKSAPANLAARIADPGLVHQSPKLGVVYLAAVVDNPVLANPLVRQALFWAMDRKRMATEVREGLSGDVTTQPWAPTSPAFDPALEVEDYDPARAIDLLKQAGFTQSAPLLLESGPYLPVVDEIVQQNLTDIGMNVSLRKLDGATYIARYTQHQYTDLFIAPHAYGNLSPISLLQLDPIYQLPNVMHYDSAEYRDILSTLANLPPTSAEAKAQYVRFNKLYREDPWAIPLYTNTNFDVVSARVQGFDEYFIMPTASPNFGKISLKA
jgi:peptide/nickel transport system substrate-binding protein